MKSVNLAIILSLTTLFNVLSLVNSYTNPIKLKGYHFYDWKTGDYFHVKGVDYYPRPNTGELNINSYDYFTDEHEDIWSPHIEYFVKLGINAVRLYSVDPTKSHDAFMCALRSNGIYALIDLASSCDNCAITGANAPECYSYGLKYRGLEIINTFSKYDNVLAFSVGNEVNHVVKKPGDNAPCQKKFIKDMRWHINHCDTSIRPIPVGAVLADDHREENALYYNCRTNPDDELENAEWYGLNTYQHCSPVAPGSEDIPTGGYAKLLDDFTKYQLSIPTLLTEFGCLNPNFPAIDGYNGQRTFEQASWIASEPFRKVFQGGFAFEYSTENAKSKTEAPYPFTSYGPQNYGLGYFSPESCDHITTPCKYNAMPNFENLANHYNSIEITGEPNMKDFTATDRTTTPMCPADFPKLDEFTWVTDSLSGVCPEKSEFVCPGQKSSGVWTKAVSESSNNAVTEPSDNAPDSGASTNFVNGTAALISSTISILYALSLFQNL